MTLIHLVSHPELFFKLTLRNSSFLKKHCTRHVDHAPVVQKVDSAIQWINLYPLDAAIGFLNTYPVDSDLSGG